MIKTEHLKKEYKNFSLDCSMQVKPGYITGLVGQNGAGKSTLFKAIFGLISTDGGTVTVLGKQPKDFTKNDKEKIGAVINDSGFSGYLCINDIILILGALYKEFDQNYFQNQINKFQLPMDKKIKDFSSGMKAKLKVAIAVSHNAKLLILDEPTAGLDVVARDELLDMLRDYMAKDDNNSILISSHISDDLQNLCDDIYMIHDGRIILHEDTDVLLSDYALIKLDSNQFDIIDKQYILRTKKEPYGYSCLTNQIQFYLENYRDTVIEKVSIDTVITMMIRGEKV